MLLHRDAFEENMAGHGGNSRSSQIRELVAQSGVDAVNLTYHPHTAASVASALSLLIKTFGFNRKYFSRRSISFASLVLASLRKDKAVKAVLTERFYFDPVFMMAAAERVPVIAAPQNIESLVPSQAPLLGRTKMADQKIEMKLLNRTSQCFAICPEDAALIRSRSGNAKVLPYYPSKERLAFLSEIRESRRTSTKDLLLALGSAVNPPTFLAMQEVIAHIAACRAQTQMSGLFGSGPVVIAGHGTDAFKHCAGEGIEVLGSIDNQTLRDCMLRAKALLVHQVPTTGSLTRIADALLAGVPVMATRSAARGYQEGNGLQVFDSVTDLINRGLESDAEPDPLPMMRPADSEKAFVDSLRTACPAKRSL